MSGKEKIAREILEEICETDEIFEDCDMDLVEEGFIDSFAVINIIILIENKMGIRLQTADVSKEEISSVNKLVAFLENLG